MFEEDDGLLIFNDEEGADDGGDWIGDTSDLSGSVGDTGDLVGSAGDTSDVFGSAGEWPTGGDDWFIG